MSLKTEGASLEAQRGWPGPGAAAIFPPRPPPPGAAGSQPCQRAMLSRCGWLSASGQAVWIRKRKEREREKPVPKTQKAVTQEALCKAAGAVQQGPHTAEAPGPRRGGEQVSEVVCVRPPRAAGAAPPRVTTPVLPPSDRQGRF